MPVEFNCSKCQTRLRMSRRKIGTVIACPRCSTQLMVTADDSESPAEPGAPAPAATAAKTPAKTPAKTAPVSAAPVKAPAVKQPAPKPQPTAKPQAQEKAPAQDKPVPTAKSQPAGQPKAAAKPQPAPAAVAAEKVSKAAPQTPPKSQPSPKPAPVASQAAPQTEPAMAAESAPAATQDSFTASVEDAGLIREFVVFDEPYPDEDEDQDWGDDKPVHIAEPVASASPSPASQPTASQPILAIAKTAPIPVVPAPVTSGKVPVEAKAVASSPAAAVQTEPVPSKESPAPAASRPKISASGYNLPDGMVLVSRGVLFFQAILILAVALFGFGAGYIIGRGDATPLVPISVSPPTQAIFVHGRLVYVPRPGEVVGDAGGVILALPEDAAADPKLPSVPLRPEEPLDKELDPAVVAAVGKLGGHVTRADAEGSFILVVPKAGKYHLLFISQHTNRPPGGDPRAEDLESLEKFFERPDTLLRGNKYHLQLDPITGPEKRLPPHNFGASQKS